MRGDNNHTQQREKWMTVHTRVPSHHSRPRVALQFGSVVTRGHFNLVSVRSCTQTTESCMPQHHLPFAVPAHLQHITDVDSGLNSLGHTQMIFSRPASRSPGTLFKGSGTATFYYVLVKLLY